MEFKIATGSVSFEFVYKNYTINIADYYLYRQSNIIPPAGKISVMVQKRGYDLSTKSIERIANYLNPRMKGNVIACGNVIEVNLSDDDQFMYFLMNGIDMILPN